MFGTVSGQIQPRCAAAFYRVSTQGSGRVRSPVLASYKKPALPGSTRCSVSGTPALMRSAVSQRAVFSRKRKVIRAMVNVDFASPSLLLGGVLIGCGVLLLQMRNVQNRVSRDADIVVAAMVSIVGSTLIFQGWRLDPLLLLCQALTTSVAVWYGLEAFRLRSKESEEMEDPGMLPPPPPGADVGYGVPPTMGMPQAMDPRQRVGPDYSETYMGAPLPMQSQLPNIPTNMYLPPAQDTAYPWMTGAFETEQPPMMAAYPEQLETADARALEYSRWGPPMASEPAAAPSSMNGPLLDYYGNPVVQAQAYPVGPDETAYGGPFVEPTQYEMAQYSIPYSQPENVPPPYDGSPLAGTPSDLGPSYSPEQQPFLYTGYSMGEEDRPLPGSISTQRGDPEDQGLMQRAGSPMDVGSQGFNDGSSTSSSGSSNSSSSNPNRPNAAGGSPSPLPGDMKQW